MTATIGSTAELAIATWVINASGLSAVFWSGQNKPRPAAPCIELRVSDSKTIGATAEKSKATKPLVLADDVIELIDPSTDTLTLTAHVYLTGDGPVRLENTGTLANGLLEDHDYWIIKTGADTVQLADSFVDAIDGVAIDITMAGMTIGSTSIVDTDDTLRAGQEITYSVRAPRFVTLEMQCFAAGDVDTARACEILDRVALALELPAAPRLLALAGVSPPTYEGCRPVGAAFKASIFEPRAVGSFTFHFTASASEDGTIIESSDVVIEQV